MHKHAVLLRALAKLTRDPAPLTVFDTHAGAGVYDLTGEAARRSGEATGGVGRLMAEAPPPALAALAQAVRRLNGGGGARFYPGSPLLILGALRPRDRYVGCELHPDDHQALSEALARHAPPGGATRQALREDGYAAAPRLASGSAADRLLLLIDPPYERGDDPARMAETLARVAWARGGAFPPALVWAPIKDLESYDALLRRLEALPYTKGWAAEARVRPLTDPMRLNGSAMIGLGLPWPSALEAISAWAAGGEPGAEGRVTSLFG